MGGFFLYYLGDLHTPLVCATAGEDSGLDGMARLAVANGQGLVGSFVGSNQVSIVQVNGMELLLCQPNFFKYTGPRFLFLESITLQSLYTT